VVLGGPLLYIYRTQRRGKVLKPEVAFGEILRQFRKLAKFSQERLAQESGLDRTYISLLERGLRQPSLNSLLKISKGLSVSSSEIVAAVETKLNENTEN
jgi:transcriptional regulator with XRE-family HTH domain